MPWRDSNPGILVPEADVMSTKATPPGPKQFFSKMILLSNVFFTIILQKYVFFKIIFYRIVSAAWRARSSSFPGTSSLSGPTAYTANKIIR
jgi:hypothetical protein